MAPKWAICSLVRRRVCHPPLRREDRGFYRPKRGRSPLRLEISALAVRKLSIAAIRRENSEEEGARATEAVLDIGIPFWRQPIPLSHLKGNLCIPNASVHASFCMAAFVLPHCGMDGSQVWNT